MDPKDVPICYDFALLFHEQREQKKLIQYSSVIGYLLGNPLGSVESRLSFKNLLTNLYRNSGWLETRGNLRRFGSFFWKTGQAAQV